MSEEELVLITGQTGLTKGCHYLHEKGAGDAFAWANKVGALTCTRCGAIDAIPRPAELVL
ncbi:hypothetical protein ABRZ24_04815 [Brenneria populi]|uniref:Uncharacterized protein n=1 Tax=Brenneria populi TaxID=1505588 RepID=A0ABU6JML6_9GAMM|nr:hypothetical protein [Brenneria populi Li et al. 2015]